MKKRFDCVEMKKRAQRRIRAAVAGMSRQEEIAYFRSGAKDFSRRLRQAKHHARAATTAK
jgi:hypothetical protein